MMRSSMWFALVLASFVFLSCANETVQKPVLATPIISEGDWRIVFDIGAEKLPMNFSVTTDEQSVKRIVFRNAEEKIVSTHVQVVGDSLVIEMPLFNSKFCLKINGVDNLSGYWVNYNKAPNYKIPVTGTHGDSHRFLSEDSAKILPNKWEVFFSPNDEDNSYKAIGLFNSLDNNVVHGTFLTETGDYRFLEGNVIGDKLKLSCFDGAHLFMFTADVNGDSLQNGMFYSGKHYDEPWEAVVNKTFELTDPEQLTQVVGKTSWKDVVVKDVSGKDLKIGNITTTDKVTIIQIMGTWCPNCIDETVFYQELLSNSIDVEIIPVCFEKEATAYDAIKKLKSRLNLPYDLYLGGKLDKKAALALFPMLSNVSSFPTSIIIDKKDRIRKVHTGFYGPGTGQYYLDYKEEMMSFINELASE